MKNRFRPIDNHDWFRDLGSIKICIYIYIFKIYYSHLHVEYYIEIWPRIEQQQLLQLIAYRGPWGRLFYILSVCWTCANICNPFFAHVTCLQLSLHLSHIIYIYVYPLSKGLYFGYVLCRSPCSEKSICCKHQVTLSTEIFFYECVHHEDDACKQSKILSKHSHTRYSMNYAGNLVYLYSMCTYS